MRKLILLLLLPVLAGAQTVIVSARNWGPDSAARDAAIPAHFIAWMNANNITGEASYVSSYEYAINDSSFYMLDLSQNDPNPLKRYFTPTMPLPSECEVSPVWCTILRHSPGKASYAKYKTWDGGPRPTGVKPVGKEQTVAVMAKAANLRLRVEADMKDGKEWKDKTNKKLNEKEKRGAAWKIATGKAKPSDYTKTNKVGR